MHVVARFGGDGHPNMEIEHEVSLAYRVIQMCLINTNALVLTQKGSTFSEKKELINESI